MGASGRERVPTELSVAAMVQRMLAVYREAGSGPGRRTRVLTARRLFTRGPGCRQSRPRSPG